MCAVRGLRGWLGSRFRDPALGSHRAHSQRSAREGASVRTSAAGADHHDRPEERPVRGEPSDRRAVAAVVVVPRVVRVVEVLVDLRGVEAVRVVVVHVLGHRGPEVRAAAHEEAPLLNGSLGGLDVVLRLRDLVGRRRVRALTGDGDTGRALRRRRDAAGHLDRTGEARLGVLVERCAGCTHGASVRATVGSVAVRASAGAAAVRRGGRAAGAAVRAVPVGCTRRARAAGRSGRSGATRRSGR